MKRIALAIALFAALLTPAFGRGHGHSTGTRSSTRTHTTRTRTTRTRTTKTHRSRQARADFMKQHPCPATGRSSGACKGYVVDHVKPLACGGADAPSNMQWQTVAEGKAKDKWERIGCK
jgi:hypothetical protein